MIRFENKESKFLFVLPYLFVKIIKPLRFLNWFCVEAIKQQWQPASETSRCLFAVNTRKTINLILPIFTQLFVLIMKFDFI